MAQRSGRPPAQEPEGSGWRLVPTPLTPPSQSPESPDRSRPERPARPPRQDRPRRETPREAAPERPERVRRPARAPRPETERSSVHFSPGARAAALVVALVVAFHVAMTAVYDFPFRNIRDNVLPIATARSYLEPLFQQDYRIFAPNPISDDRSLLVRAWIRTDAGMRVTEWVNATDAEISSMHRRLLRKQFTILTAERLVPAFRALTDEQQAVADENWHRSGFPALRTALLETSPGTERAVDTFIRVSEAATAYGTQVAYALWGADTVVAVQVRATYEPVVRWDDRNDPAAERPQGTLVNPGWRPAVEYAGQDREAFADIFLDLLGDDAPVEESPTDAPDETGSAG